MPIYDAMRKTDRDKDIVKYARLNPLLSYDEIGQAYGGIKRARVSQICRAAGLKRRK